MYNTRGKIDFSFRGTVQVLNDHHFGVAGKLSTGLVKILIFDAEYPIAAFHETSEKCCIREKMCIVAL